MDTNTRPDTNRYNYYYIYIYIIYPLGSENLRPKKKNP